MALCQELCRTGDGERGDMKTVIYIDKHGYKHGALLRDSDDESHPQVGIPLNPPPIDSLIKDAARELHNELVTRGLFTWEDIQRSQNGLTDVILAVFRRKLIEAYRNEARKIKE